MQNNSSGSRFFSSPTSTLLDQEHPVNEQPQSYHYPSYKPSIMLTKDPLLSNRSRTRTKTTNYSSHHPISSLTNQLKSLKNDFNELFLKDGIRQEEGGERGEEEQKRREREMEREKYRQRSGMKSPESYFASRKSYKHQSPLYQDIDSSSKYSTSSLLTLQQQNISLKSQLKRSQIRYQTKKEQYQQLIHHLYRTIEQLSEQLQTNEESLMVCKLELENEMECIREQLRSKKEAEISLEDYGELIEINANLKEEIGCYVRSIDEMKGELEKGYRKEGELERGIGEYGERVRDLEGSVRVERAKREGSEKELRERMEEIEKITRQNREIHLLNMTLSNQLQEFKQKPQSPQPSISFEQYQQLTAQNSSLQQQLLSYLQQIGEANAQCFLFRNNYELLHEQHQKCQNNKVVGVTDELERWKDENRRQKEIMDDMVGFIKQLEDIKGKLQMDREAMLSDIMFMERELRKRDEEINVLRVKVAEKESEVGELKLLVSGLEIKNRETLFEERGVEKNHSGTVFIPSQEVSEQVMNDFDGLLNSPKVETRPKLVFNMIPEVVTNQPNDFYSQEYCHGDHQQLKNAFNINHISDLKRYISGEQDNQQLAVSIIVSENKSEVVEMSRNGESEIKDESMLIDNGSGLRSYSEDTEVSHLEF